MPIATETVLGLDYGKLKTAALVFFFLVFSGILLWLFFFSRSGRFERASRLPLDEPGDERPERHSGRSG